MKKSISTLKKIGVSLLAMTALLGSSYTQAFAATASTSARSMVNTNYSTQVNQNTSYRLTVDGVDKTSAVNFVAQGDRSMIGLRDFAGVLGCTVDWDNEKVAIVTKGSTTLEVPIGSKQILVNGKQVNIDEQGTISIIVNSKTYLPFRVIVESLGYTVGWDSTTKTITLTSGSGTTPQQPTQAEKPIENKYGVQVPAGMENTTWLEQYNYFRDEYGMTDAQAQQNMTQVHPAPLWTSDKRNKGNDRIMSDAQQKHYNSINGARRAAVDNGTASQMPTEAGSVVGEMRDVWRFNGSAGWTKDMGAYTCLNGYGD